MSKFDSESSVDEVVQENIQRMNEIAGFGVVMVCCSSEKQVKFESYSIFSM